MALDIWLLFSVILGITILMVLILFFKIQAFLSLLIASITVGLMAGLDPDQMIHSIQNGMGSTLGFVATVVGLGALFGAVLEHSGGAQALAKFLLSKFGEQNAHWALVLTGFFVAIPVFFDVAFIILVPLVYALQRKTGKSLLLFGLPLLAGLAITHSFIPPTPGPVAVADIIKADLGWVILVGLIAGIPTAFVVAPIFSKWIAGKIHIQVPAYAENVEAPVSDPPSVFSIACIISTPLLLILTNTVFNSPLGNILGLGHEVHSLFALVGHPFTALIVANLIAWYVLGIRRGHSRQELGKITGKSLAPAGVIILLTGAGGVFKQVLIDTKAGTMLAEQMNGLGLSPLIFAFLVAAVVRMLQGSATVAMITAAGLTAPILGPETSDWTKALLVIAIASGATILSHVNDSGFWLVNRYFGLTELQTIRSWSAMTTIVSISGFLIVLLLSWF